MRYYCLIVLILSQILAFSQENKSFVLHGKVIDESRKGILNANIVVKNTGTVSDKQGEFFLKLENLDTQISISHINFFTNTLTISQLKDLEQVNDTLIAVILLKEKINTIQEVFVSSKSEPIEVLSNQLLDYEFYKNELVCLIQKHNGPYLKNLKTQREYKLPFINALSLKKDLFGELHILTQDSVYQIYLKDNFKVYPAITKSDFFENVFKYKLNTPNALIYIESPPKNNNYCGQMLIVSKFDKLSKKTSVLLNAFDERMFNVLYQDSINIIREYNKLTHPFRNKIKNRTWNGTIEDLTCFDFDFNTMVIWYTKVMYKPLYIKIIGLSTKFCIIDYSNDLIYHYNDELIKTVPFSFSKIKDIKRELIFDEIKQKSYILISKNEYVTLKLIDLEAGILKQTYHIGKPFSKNIKINDDFVYFIIENTQLGEHNKLYKLPL